MALEAAKTLAFSAGCQLLHFDLLEAREVISLLPRFADAPFSLHLAVLQALIALLVRTDSYERPYLASLSALLLDLLRFLRPETRFDSVEALRGAMENDRKQALKIIDSNEYAL